MRIGSNLGSNAFENSPTSHLNGFNSRMRMREAKTRAFNNYCQSIKDKQDFSTAATNRNPVQNTPKQSEPFNPEAAIKKLVKDTAAYLDFKIGKIFEEDKSKQLSGKSGVEYQESLKQLTRAVEGQDYDNAKKILKEFYSGDSDQIITKIEDTLTQVEDKFWGNMKKVLGQMREIQGLSYTDGLQDQNGVSGYDLVDMAIKNARQKTGALSDMDFSQIIDEIREDSVDSAARMLRKSGIAADEESPAQQAENAIQSTALYTKHVIFGAEETADISAELEQKMNSRIKEQRSYTNTLRSLRFMTFDDVQESNPEQTITDEQLARSAAMGASSESKFSQQLSKMGSTVVDELKSLLAKTKRDGPAVQTEELNPQESKAFKQNTPADYVGNEDWRSYRDDLNTLYGSATQSYVSRHKALLHSISTSGSTKKSSFSHWI